MDQFDFLEERDAPIPILNNFNFLSANDDGSEEVNRTGDADQRANTFNYDATALDQINSLALGGQPDDFLKASQEYTPENETSPFTLADVPEIPASVGNGGSYQVKQRPQPQRRRQESYLDELDTFGFAPSNLVNDDQTPNSLTQEYSSPSPAVNISTETSQSYTPNLNPQYFSPRLQPVKSTRLHRQSSISNAGKSFSNAPMGTSLNNILSPSSTYDFDNSPYGSFGGSSFNEPYLNSPLASPSLRAIGSPASYGTHMNPKGPMSKEGKISRRRELHNAVERRRRDLIKERIKELGALIPQSLLHDKTKDAKEIKEIKANKGLILVKTVEYISHLQRIMGSQDDRLELLLSRISELEIAPKYDASREQLDQQVFNNNDNNPQVKLEEDSFDFLNQDFLKETPSDTLNGEGYWNEL
ncbi:unnamed protein product [Kuraishia capsulata CBS 1993]|uniref:BHLH domain-containing protein n=1 Tax=Kuraishia capsulata CBS 1993 TaxID=1382522 RepID=W6MSF1_9ASCO|nr:uncharacterized protein KUCA_T00005724001 [Kuraishia capsulata CBS 1993]CDK29731.1 unnamed protein product [Kuraishia capsulata CBS 1993]